MIYKLTQLCYTTYIGKYSFYFIGMISLLYTSCSSAKHAGGKSGKHLYESFYVGEAGTQYFIKPLAFTNKASEESKLDFTFRHKDAVKDSAVVNMTFHTIQNLKTVDSIIIKNMVFTSTIYTVRYMYAERNKDKYNCRFTAKAPLADVKKLFGNSQWIIIRYHDGEATKLMSIPRTNEAIAKLEYEIFSLF